jgi:hypothetical protein
MIDRFTSFFASVPRADASGQDNARAFIFCLRRASIDYSRIARIFESGRSAGFFAFPHGTVLAPGLN